MLSQKPWRLEAVILLVAGVFACLSLGVVAVGVLRQIGVSGFKTPDSFGGVLVATLSFQGAACGLMGLFLKYHQVTWREAFGLRRADLRKSLLLAVGVLAVALPVVLLLQQLSALGLEKIGWAAEDQRAVDLIAGSKTFWQRGYFVVFAVVLAPVAEEFIFRGVLFPFFRQLGRPWLAWLGVSFLFAIIHLNAPTLVPLLVLALVLTWLYEFTDCLLAPILAHSLFNGVNLLVLFFGAPVLQWLHRFHPA